ncbi:MAG TPA: alcohol dehydrogenase catalytic domain-containing protein [Actinophytocola sp.]|uniref:alcohol dehydrogenase catalytic domain-containing protein n=1 Tax=Actinophytocola sp. TaxID=1872138 RepID=UPI002DDD850C|nr:alcohol dehydrogenase catalytic domain-containing protein [Actinophytocola sp.]HEV2784718.1 alcohol dehydrogenase catalytic domain-containing protein [Actinophytocola sp.]
MVNAAVVAGRDAEIEIRDIVLPELAADRVRVRVAAAGICHSDLSMVNGTLRPSFPLVLGHEASGVVAAVGPGVTRVSPGDRVVVNWAPPCRHCWFCLNGQPYLCRAVEGVASLPGGILDDGTPLHLAMGVGAFAGEVVLPAAGVVPLADGVPLDLAALLGCAVLTGVGAVRNTARVRPGESVVVIGLGGVGLSAIAGARLSGAGPIIAVDVSAEKEKIAIAAGATHFVAAHDKQAKQIRALTGGRGADHAFECVGRSATIRAAWGCTRRGGQVTVVGVGRQDDQVSLNALEIYHFARTIAVSVYGSGDADRDLPWLAEQITLGHLDLEPLVSHRIGLDGIPEAFRRMEAGVGARSLLVFD